MTTTVSYQSFEMEMTDGTTDEEIRACVEGAADTQYDAIDEQEITQRAWEFSKNGGFYTSERMLLLTDADEIEAHLLEIERDKVRERIETLISGLINQRNEVFQIL